MKATELTPESTIEKAAFYTFPNIILSIAALVLFFIRTVVYPSFEYSSFQLFLYFFFTNLVLWIAVSNKDPNRTHKNNSGYVLFFLLLSAFPYLLISGGNFQAWDLYVFSLILLFRFAYRMRYGGVPVLSFVANAILMYLLVHQQPITWFIGVYYGLQLIEIVIETKLQGVSNFINKKLGMWIFLLYYVYLALLFGKTI